MRTLTPTEQDLAFLAATLRKLEFFSGMSMGDLERVLRSTRMMEYGAGKVVFKKGEVGDALYFVYEGTLRVVAKRPFIIWPAKTIARLGPGDLFGEMALFEQPPYRTASVVTETPARLFVLLVSSVTEIFPHNDAFIKSLAQIARLRKFEMKRS